MEKVSVCVCLYIYIYMVYIINQYLEYIIYPLQYIVGVDSMFFFHCKLFSHFHHVPLFLTHSNAWSAGALPKATPCYPNKHGWICS